MELDDPWSITPRDPSAGLNAKGGIFLQAPLVVITIGIANWAGSKTILIETVVESLPSMATVVSIASMGVASSATESLTATGST